MKTFFIACLKCFFSITCLANDSAERKEWFAERQTWIERSVLHKDEQTIRDLSSILYGVGRNLGDASGEASDLYFKAQSILLSIPGHARYFEEKRREARAKCVNLALDTTYEQACLRMTETLRHLPSPETVQVLGRLLESNEDVPSEEQLKDYRRLERQQGAADWYTPHSIGFTTLPYLGIRGIGETPKYIQTYATEPFTLLRPWWEEVKAGKRTFSFKGQKVEYRFNPDGTWETLVMANPPDDGPAKPDVGARNRSEQKPQPPSTVETSSISKKRLWPWIVGAVAALLIASLRCITRRLSTTAGKP